MVDVKTAFLKKKVVGVRGPLFRQLYFGYTAPKQHITLSLTCSVQG